MIPETKKVCNEISAADVMGPLDKGERIRARKGANIVVAGNAKTSKTVR